MKTQTVKRTRRHVVARLTPAEARAILFLDPRPAGSPALTRGERRSLNSLQSKLTAAMKAADVIPEPSRGPTRFKPATTLAKAHPPRGQNLRKGGSI